MSSLGWLTETTIVPSKKKVIGGISANSYINLKAAIYDQLQSNLLSSSSSGALVTRRSLVGDDEKIINKGVEQRIQRDNQASVNSRLGESEEASFERSRKTLEKKAQLYEERLMAISSFEENDDDDHKNDPLWHQKKQEDGEMMVNFDQKWYHQKLARDEQNYITTEIHSPTGTASLMHHEAVQSLSHGDLTMNYYPSSSSVQRLQRRTTEKFEFVKRARIHAQQKRLLRIAKRSKRRDLKNHNTSSMVHSVL